MPSAETGTLEVYMTFTRKAIHLPIHYTFWLLAKLFIVIHFYRNHVSSNADEELQIKESLSSSSGSDELRSSGIIKQTQVAKWLWQIRQGQGSEPFPVEIYLSQVFNARS